MTKVFSILIILVNIFILPTTSTAILARAEVFPVKVEIFKATNFLLYLTSEEFSFNSVEITLFPKGGRIVDFRGLSILDREVEPDSVVYYHEHLIIYLPKTVKNGELVVILFRAQLWVDQSLLPEGKTTFACTIANDEQKQNVPAGDVLPEVESNSLSVSLPTNTSGGEIFMVGYSRYSWRRDLLICDLSPPQSPFFTPNDDGIHDLAPIWFGIYNVISPVPVSVVILGHFGKVIRTLLKESIESGVYQVYWNGRKDDGTPAAQGIYRVRISVKIAGKTHTVERKLALFRSKRPIRELPCSIDLLGLVLLVLVAVGGRLHRFTSGR